MSAPNSASLAPNSSDNPVLNYYNEWVEKTPLITRNTLILLCIVYLISWFTDVNIIFGDIPYFSILRFEFYRLLTAPLVGNSILSILMIFLFFPQMGGRLESSMGSTAYLFLMIMISLVTNLLFLATCFSLFLMGIIQAILWNCSGFWTILFAFITVECLMNPDVPRQLLFIPINIPAKYFPLVLYAFFSIFNGPDLSLFLSMVVGLLYCKGYLDRLKMSSYYAESLEAPGSIFHGLSRFRGWALAGTGGHDPWIAVNAADVSSEPPSQAYPSQGRTISGGSGSGPGFPNIGGFSRLRDEESGDSGPETRSFPGSGHKLTSPSAPSAMSLPQFSSTSNQTANVEVNKELLAQRRLAALNALNSNKSTNTRVVTNSAGYTSLPPESSHGDDFH